MRACVRACVCVCVCVCRQPRGAGTYEWRETRGPGKLERGNDTVVGLNHLLIGNRVGVQVTARVG